MSAATKHSWFREDALRWHCTRCGTKYRRSEPSDHPPPDADCGVCVPERRDWRDGWYWHDVPVVLDVPEDTDWDAAVRLFEGQLATLQEVDRVLRDRFRRAERILLTRDRVAVEWDVEPAALDAPLGRPLRAEDLEAVTNQLRSERHGPSLFFVSPERVEALRQFLGCRARPDPTTGKRRNREGGDRG